MRECFAAVSRWGRLVHFSHSIFALPFALSMYVIAARFSSHGVVTLACLLAALVAARTAAMCFNRIVDRHIDAQNVRTMLREIPAGVVSVRSAVALLLLSSLAFLAAAAMLGMHCLALAPLVLLLLFGYSLCKRFSSLSHFVLGACLAMAPGGVWYAVTGEFSWIPVPLMAGVLFWVAGFDVLYSCQDFEFDSQHALHSVPAALGVRFALWIARACHVVAVLFLAAFGLSAGLGPVYYAGLGLFALVIASQHRCITPEDFSRINAAFFTRNGFASVLFFISVSLDSVLR